MAEANTPDTVREAVGIFHDADKMQSAIDDLLMAGFSQAELSLVASEETVRDKLGHMYERVEDTEDDPDIPREIYVAPESRGDAQGGLIGGLLYVGAVAAAGAVVATGGTVAAAIAAAAAAGIGGGVVGSALATILEKRHADYIQEQMDRGGLILWVNIRDAEHEKKAVDILSKYSGDDVHVHDIKQ
ncbi:MAG TPA: hypothetical protein VKA18_09140 [Alphaproteobacteria bacterium]|nr:hypothetical protein [Alphaproteobacteria bacterium]